MKIINGDLILTEDYSIEDALIVRGNIICKNGLWNIKAWNIEAWNIEALDIEAGNIKAWDIEAGNIEARDIEARNIEARDISYYAVCFAYKNIICKSIKGRRGNSKHFVLDGEIKLKNNQVGENGR